MKSMAQCLIGYKYKKKIIIFSAPAKHPVINYFFVRLSDNSFLEGTRVSFLIDSHRRRKVFISLIMR